MPPSAQKSCRRLNRIYRNAFDPSPEGRGWPAAAGQVRGEAIAVPLTRRFASPSPFGRGIALRSVPSCYSRPMCGIFGYVGPRDPVPLIMGGLKSLEYRGYDSAGIAIVEDGKLLVRRCSGKLKNLEDLLVKEPVTGQFGLGHTRWATHGRPTEENAHPHRDCRIELSLRTTGSLRTTFR